MDFSIFNFSLFCSSNSLQNLLWGVPTINTTIVNEVQFRGRRLYQGRKGSSSWKQVYPWIQLFYSQVIFVCIFLWIKIACIKIDEQILVLQWKMDMKSAWFVKEEMESN